MHENIVYAQAKTIYNAKEMENSILTQTEPLAVFRAVSHAEGNNARRITLPATWVKRAMYPQEVHIIVGDLIIVSTVEEKDKALKAVEYLVEQGLMTALPERSLMQEIGK